MLRSVITVATALVLLAVGAMTATAGNRPAQGSGQRAAPVKAGAMTTLISGAMLEVKAQGHEEKAQEAAQAQAAAAAPQAQPQAETDSETADDATDANDNEPADEAAPAAPRATNTEQQQGSEHDD